MTEGRSGRHTRARQVDPELKSETLFQKERTERARRGGSTGREGRLRMQNEITGSAVKSNFRTESKNQGRSGCKGSRFLSLSSRRQRLDRTKVGCRAKGLSFKSKVVGGRTSDEEETVDSGFVQESQDGPARVESFRMSTSSMSFRARGRGMNKGAIGRVSNRCHGTHDRDLNVIRPVG